MKQSGLHVVLTLKCKITCGGEGSPRQNCLFSLSAAVRETEKSNGGGICLCSVVVIYEEKGVSVCGCMCVCVRLFMSQSYVCY